jgi:choice-of-anchor C domain-containing protein
MKKILTILATLGTSGLMLVLSAGVASAASLVTNGSFEAGTNPGSYLTVNAGDSTSITGWTITSGSVDYIGSYWQASDGVRSLDLSGNQAGASSQSFATIPGQSYQVAFDLSGNPDGTRGTKTVEVSATGATPADYTYDTSAEGNTLATMKWQSESYTFTATSNSTTLAFTSLVNSPYGPALDNVAVIPVCTPTGFFRDGMNLTAAVVDPASPISGDIDATGCNVGVFFGTGNNGSVSSANIHGANYFGVLVQSSNVDVVGSTIAGIGETPHNGSQHGIGIYYATLTDGSAGGNGSCTSGATTGTIIGNTVSDFQKGGIVGNCTGTNVSIENNTVAGVGPVSYIAQNGIQLGYGATGSVTGNTVSGNYCTDANPGDDCTANPTAGNPNADGSAGILLYSPGSNVTVSGNTLTGNQYSIWTVGAPSVTITGNDITGAGGSTDTGIAIWNTDQWGATPTGTTGSIDHNTIAATNYAVLLDDYGSSGSNQPAMIVNRNDISGGSTDGLWTNITSSNTNGTCNWWGAASGPGSVGSGSGSHVTVGVNFTPWLTSSNLSGECEGGLPPTTITVHNRNSGTVTVTTSSSSNTGGNSANGSTGGSGGRGGSARNFGGGGSTATGGNGGNAGTAGVGGLVTTGNASSNSGSLLFVNTNITRATSRGR